MKKTLNECCDCGLYCLGDYCPNRHVTRWYCDECGEDITEERYEFGGEDLCAGCLIEKLPKRESPEGFVCSCGEESETVCEVDGKLMCEWCARDECKVR